MNKSLYSICAAILACSIAHGQTTAYTNPVGYTTQTLAANSFSLVGFNVLPSTVIASKVTNLSGSDVLDSTIDFSTVLPAGKMCVLEITSGAAAGTVQEFNAWNSTAIHLALPITGLLANDNYSVRVCVTLQELFSVGFLAGSSFATTADKVWVPAGAGVYTKYWYKTTSPIGWHTTTTGSNDGGVVNVDIPLVHIDGILVEKKGTVKDLVMSGEVKKTGSNVYLETGINLVSINPPSGLTLYTAGLQGDIAGSSFASTADVVWVPAGSGTYTKYWYKTTSPVGWHTTSTGSNDLGLISSDVSLPPSIFIQRKGANKIVTLDVPAGYSGL